MGKYLTWLNKKCHKSSEFTHRPISRSQARDSGMTKILKTKKKMRVLLLITFSIIFRRSVCEEVMNCGGVYSGFQYPIVSPNYPENYPPDRDCVYILKGIQSAKCDQEFHLQFLDFELEASKGCGKDYVKIGGESIYCGNSIGIRKFKGQDKSLKIIFHSDQNTTARGFRILVTTLPCSGDSGLESNQTTSTTTSALKENSGKISHPSFRLESKFTSENTARKDQQKNPSENLQLPELQHHFHDQNCAHGTTGSVTSYLYLPPEGINSPSKNTGLNRSPSIPDDDNISGIIPDAVVIENLEEPPADLILPLQRAPPSFLQKTRHSFLQRKRPQGSSEFFDPTNRWLTYGTPNSSPGGVSPLNPSNDFDPFGNNGSPNCGGSSNPPSYYPNGNNGNFNPGYNPVENFSPGSNVNVPYPNAGGGDFWISNDFYNPVDTSYWETGLSQCCGTVYTSSSFLLVNPGFPALIYSSSNYECQYTIRRSSESVCGLRMNLKFFNFGSEDQFCAYGYVEIDGTRICGCKTGANLTSSFENIATKTLTVKYLGYPRNKFSGFVIEVTQVPCASNFLRFGIDREPIFPRIHGIYKRSTDPVPEEDKSSSSRGTRDVEYLSQGISTTGLRSQNFLINTCRIFKFVNWVKAAKQVYLRSAQCSSRTTGNTPSTTGVISAISVIPIFPDTGNSALINYPLSSNCETVNLAEGTISSPYYPNGYSNNLNQCYRFYKAPGYCQLELAMLDFDLENSTLCRKDYVSFSGKKRRYCGSSLSGTRTIFDMTQATFADLYFASDSSGTGRGFRAGFTQIPC